MSELGSMKPAVLKAIAALGPVCIENSVGPGTPDVNYVGGWVELKWLRDWPARADTPVRLEHYTQQQKIWGMKRWMYGGASYLLLSCKGEWLVFDGVTAAKHVGQVPYARLRELCIGYWSPMDAKGMLEFFKRGRGTKE